MAAQGLRVGLTGGLGSGKSTVAAMLAQHGAHILSADEIGRALMQPGEPVFDQIVSTFGPQALLPDGTLNRPALARMAFAEGRLEELNAIVHPATIARQQQLAEAIFAAHPDAIVIVESALIFESRHGVLDADQPWRSRFDQLILVTALSETKIARFIARSGGGDPEALRAEAQRRLAQQIPDEQKSAHVDYILHNDSTREHLQQQVDALWQRLRS